MKSDDKLVWIDLEMTGLKPELDHILEIATLITDGELEIIAEGPELVIHQGELLAGMDEWNQQHHGASGLIDRVKASTTTCAQAQAATLDFVRSHCAPGKAPLCGNSVWQDRRFLYQYMPQLEAYLHYRIIDVSSIKELARRWYPKRVHRGKKGAHRALQDIKESIEELRFYRKNIFKKP